MNYEGGHKVSADYNTKREVEAAFKRSYNFDRKQNHTSVVLKNMGYYEFYIATEFGEVKGECYITRNF